jgi:release factor glutamine methyltransferase
MSEDQPWTIGRLLTWTTDFFAERGSESPRLEAEILLAKVRDCSRIELYTSFAEEVDEAMRGAYRQLVRKRADGTPVAYLVGKREFYSLEFHVTPDVLIPRPETEMVVVAVLDLVKQDPVTERTVEVADLGTGSGVLAVCVAKHVPHAQVAAIDVSEAALEIARGNALQHNVLDRIEFLHSDLFASVPTDKKFDYILSNPPYVSTAEMAQLPVDVREHEPHLALHAGARGTELVERLVSESTDRLVEGARLLIEISPMIASEVEAIIRASPHLVFEQTIPDHAGRDRVAQARRVSS